MKVPINHRYHEADWDEIKEHMHLSHQISLKALAEREIKVEKVPTVNPRTYVPRIVRPTRACRFTKRFVSQVEVDHHALKMCCGKWKVNSELYVYVHRISP